MLFNIFARNYLEWEDYKKLISTREHLNFIQKMEEDSLDNLWSRIE